MEIKTNIRARHLGPRLRIGGKPYIAGICLHDTAGTGKHNDTLYLANPSDGRTVSVDYTVERDGSIYELNPDIVQRCTWHAGRATKFIADGRVFRNRGVTQVLIGIELCHAERPDSMSPIWPDEQVKAVAELCFYLCKRFDLTKDRVTTHQRIIQDGSRTDPRTFPFDSFWFWFNKLANVPAIDNPGGPLAGPVIHNVVKGDTLSKLAKQYRTSIEAIKALNQIGEMSTLIRIGQKLIIQK